MSATARHSAPTDALFSPWSEGPGPGVAVAVVQGGDIVYQRCYGLANIENGVALTENSVLRLGSTTKHLTATCLLILENRGLLSIDDAVKDHIPEFPDFDTPLTLRHLLTMNSGLRDHLTLLLLDGLDAGHFIGKQTLFRMATAPLPLVFRPGEDVVYSNTNYTLLSEIVERVSGQSLRDFMDRELFAPLGMTQTRLVPQMSETVPGMAKGYVPGPEGAFSAGFMGVYVDGAGGVNAPLVDMIKWFRNYRDDQVFGPNYRQRMEADVHLEDGQLSDYRLGISVKSHRGLKAVRHGGGMPGYACDFVFYPEPDIGVILLANVLDLRIYALADRIADVLLNERPVPQSPRPNFAPGLYLSESSDLLVMLAEESQEHAAYVLGERNPLVRDGAGWRSTKNPIHIEVTGGNGEAGLEVRIGARAAQGLRPIQDPRDVPVPLPADYEDFAGVYRNETLGIEQVVEAGGGEIAIRLSSRMRGLVWNRLFAVAEDLFVAPVEGEPSCTNVVIRFRRDGQGAVCGLRYSLSRCEDLDFEKVSEVGGEAKT